jgi:Na+-translocating ferredoxin:NAD+ oxidoreductase RnfG subunit
MKPLLILFLAFIFAGCESSRQSASLTSQQATTTAMRLANDKASALYQHQPFVAGQPAQFVAGHWLWVARQGFGSGDIQATVELAADGSTNSVSVQLYDSKAPPSMVQ